METVDHYRSYIVNCSFGEALVKGWLEAGASAALAERWAAFLDLVGSARPPEALLERPAR